jgi:hypothetical protein
MPAGPEHDHHPQQGKPGLRAAWLGSRRVAVLAGVITVGVLAGAGVAVAATGSSSPTPAPIVSPPTPSARPPLRALLPKGAFGRIHGSVPFGPAFAGPGPLGGGLFGAVHGTVVVPKPGGGYQTVAFQNGKVTAVSSTSITLRSADGYSHSYQVTSSTMVNAQRDGIGSIKAGNQVIVAGTVSGSTTTAVRILDLSQLQQGLHRFLAPGPQGSFKPAVPNS